MMVDDRHNYFMSGITIAILIISKKTLWYLIFIIILIMVIGYSYRKFKAFGEADINAIQWIFLGMASFNFFYLLVFIVTLAILGLIYTFLKCNVFKYEGKTPYFGVILLSFIVVAAFFGLY
jgi:hypothetical protein